VLRTADRRRQDGRGLAGSVGARVGPPRRGQPAAGSRPGPRARPARPGLAGRHRAPVEHRPLL